MIDVSKSNKVLIPLVRAWSMRTFISFTNSTRGRSLNPFSQGMVHEDKKPLKALCVLACLNPFSQGMVHEDPWSLSSG